MSTTVLFTLEDYEHMIACGAFAPPHHRRCELIRGEIRDMSPIGPEQGEMIDTLDDWSHDVKRNHNFPTGMTGNVGRISNPSLHNSDRLARIGNPCYVSSRLG